MLLNGVSLSRGDLFVADQMEKGMLSIPFVIGLFDRA